jgi:Fe2+ or Zn2+ uptake regulation protein
MPRTPDSIVAALLDRNARVTAPRKEIIESISSVPRTFTAEDVCADLPHIGRATVYRTLKILQDADIICKVVMPGDDMVYSVSADFDNESGDENIRSHHHHAVCTVCNAVRYFNAEAIERAIGALSRSVEGVMGEIIDHRIEVYDVCPRCVASDEA